MRSLSLSHMGLLACAEPICPCEKIHGILKRACLVMGKESIDLIILHYNWNNKHLMGICIVKDFTLILVCIDLYS